MNTAELQALAVGVGYQMLGSCVDAEDIAQETMMRIRKPVESGSINNVEAFVTTVATRLAIDELRSARRRREYYVGPWLPEPIVQTDVDPVERADSLSYALMVVLDALSPLERATFLLHDVFKFDYDELARMLDRTPAACRQLASRARRHVADHELAPSAEHATHVRLLEGFLAAASGTDMSGLVELLTEDVELVSDGGANRKAARKPIVGKDRVARFLRFVFPKITNGQPAKIVTVNGGPGFRRDRRPGCGTRRCRRSHR